MFEIISSNLNTILFKEGNVLHLILKVFLHDIVSHVKDNE